jgi:hypothetical protein
MHLYLLDKRVLSQGLLRCTGTRNLLINIFKLNLSSVVYLFIRKRIERKPRSWPVHRNRLHTPPSVSVYLIYLLQSLPLV